MQFFDRSTHLFIADPELNPLPNSSPLLKESYRQMIISVSGWRKVFASDNDEESTEKSISQSDALLVALSASAFSTTFNPKKVIIGVDSRPTGAAIADIVTRVLLSFEIEVIHLFITAAPEIMAYNATVDDSYFFYITASHNPIGHNGFKFGKNGRVLTKEEIAPLIERFHLAVDTPSFHQDVIKRVATVDQKKYLSLLESIENSKKEALKAYQELVLTTASVDSLKEGNLGIVGELNGSARSLSIDLTLFETLGVKSRFYNTTVGNIVHPIVPEGENLDMCRTLLAQAYREDCSFRLGYVPDNDGDRGNIVYIDENGGTSHTLSSQTLFALISLIELTLTKKEGVKQALVVNCATSLAVDEIAQRVGATLFRAEVGEANVVALAQKVRESGYEVPLLGEGSNGGNITHPSQVRDPLNTVLALLKMLSSEQNFRAVTSIEGPPSIAKALLSLPKRITTETDNPEAKMAVLSTDQALLKSNYERLFLLSFKERLPYLKKEFGIYDFREEQSEGVNYKVGFGEEYRSELASGGLKMLFLNRESEPTDFIWMRASGTEPLFRIMADTLGEDQRRYDYFLRWHRSLIEQADKESTLHQR